MQAIKSDVRRGAGRDSGSGMRTIRFGPDASTRKRYFSEASFQHPAKMHCGLVAEIAARYELRPGDWVLDPMGGSGTTMLLALQGINVCLVELEEHFVTPMRASWEKMRQHPMLGYSLGDVLILRGDARALPIASADAVITSPPFQDQTILHDMEFTPPHHNRKNKEVYTRYTRPAAIITSPPYDGSIQGEPGIDWTKVDDGKRNMSLEAAQATRVKSLSGYTRPAAIITSPPYEQAENRDQRAVLSGAAADMMTRSYRSGTHSDTQNIGNLRNNAYWSEISKVYQECYRVLRPGGLLCLVLKGYTRAGEYVDLPGMTTEMLQSMGWLLHDHWRRELWSLSFWRILQRRRDPEAFDDRLNFEEVLCFRKPEQPAQP